MGLGLGLEVEVEHAVASVSASVGTSATRVMWGHRSSLGGVTAGSAVVEPWADRARALGNGSHRSERLRYFALVAEAELAEGLSRLRQELASGAWNRRYGQLRSLPELDLGHRLLIAELA